MPTANGLTVLEATVWRPRQGRWTADVSCDGESASEVSGAVTLDLDGSIFKGTARQAGAFQGRVGLFVVAGSGRLHEELPAKFYRDVPLSVPLGDILSAVGETLSATASATILARQLPNWTRAEGPATDALRQLVDAAGATWRHLEDGTFWVGTETWPEQTLEHELLEELSSDAQAVIAPQKLELRPGVTFLGRHVEHVTHRLSAGQLRTEALFTSGASPSGRLRQALESLVHRLIAPTTYDALRPAKVVGQNADGTLELVPEDPTFPGLSKVPIRNGLPGTKVTVPTGERVLFGFEGRDPRAPFAALWPDSTGVSMIEVGAGSQFVALAPLVEDFLSSLLNWLSAHTHGGVTTGGGVSGAPSPTPTLPAVPSLAAQKLKSE